jgi:undecaprenyl-diphosphatase
MGQGEVLSFAVVLGILFDYRKEDFERAACFVCFVMIFNTLLKNIFKVPLFPHLGHGYAFPSGHMHVAAIFYGYFIYRTRSHAVQAILISLLGCVASSIVYKHFHDWYDIFGATVFTCLEIAGYHFLRKRYGEWGTDIISILLVITVFCTLQSVYGAKSYNWLALYVFSGIVIGKRLCGKIIITRWSQKLVSLSIWAGMAAIVRFFNKNPSRYFLFMIGIYLSIWLASNLYKPDTQSSPENQE